MIEKWKDGWINEGMDWWIDEGEMDEWMDKQRGG